MSDDTPDSYDVTAQWSTAPNRNLITLKCSSQEPKEAQEFMDRLKPVIDENLHQRNETVPKEDLRALVEDWREKAKNHGQEGYHARMECAQELLEVIND